MGESQIPRGGERCGFAEVRAVREPPLRGGSGVKGSAPPQGDRPVAPTGVWLFSCRSGGWLWICGWRWKTPGGRCPCHTAQSDSAAPIAIQWGFGRPGTVGRYRPAALKCSTHHGPIRAGCPGWLLRGWLHCAKASRAPGPAVGPTGVICPTLPKRPGAGSNGGNDLDTGGTEDFSARSGPSA